MPDKWATFRDAVGRLSHDFGFADCEFQNWTETGIKDGQPTGDYAPIGTIECEFVPPQDDASVDTEGTHLGFDTSVNALEDDLDTLDESLVSYGVDSEKPTRIVPQVPAEVTYELQATIVQHGSGIRKLRLAEV